VMLWSRCQAVWIERVERSRYIPRFQGPIAGGEYPGRWFSLVSRRQTLQYFLILFLNILKSAIKQWGPIRVKACYIICAAIF
jgi:hypothetical protein